MYACMWGVEGGREGRMVNLQRARAIGLSIGRRWLAICNFTGTIG